MSQCAERYAHTVANLESCSESLDYATFVARLAPRDPSLLKSL